MEVTHLEESDKHIVVGGKKARSFGIATTPEFIEVLSSALYSNKELAVVREVMCNAWDSHISANKTDTPIEVIISRNKIVFIDHGLGIHDDMIEDVYCMYGESTKRNEGLTTGGFGLGSKSPFALSDTFTVTSSHNGTKTIYAVSKGSDDTDGLPALHPIVSVPTTVSGLKVEIPVDEDMGEKLYTLACRVAFYGEMNAFIKYEDREYICTQDDLKLQSSDCGYIITPEYFGYAKYDQYNHIWVKYGAVIYPVELKDEYEVQYKAIVQKLRSQATMGGFQTYHKGNILIQAEPDTLSLAPSREALSYSKQTIATVNALLNKVVYDFDVVKDELFHAGMTTTWNAFLEHYGYDSKEEFLILIAQMHKINTEVKNFNFPNTIHTRQQVNENFLAPRYEKKDRKEYRSFFWKKLIAHTKANKQYWHHKVAYQAYRMNKRNRRYDDSIHYKELYKDVGSMFNRKVFNNLLTAKVGYSRLERVKASDISEVAYHYDTGYKPFEVFISYTQTAMNMWRKDSYHSCNFINILIIPRTMKDVDINDVADRLEAKGYNVVRVFEMPKYNPERAPSVAKGTSGKKLAGYALLRDVVGPSFDLAWDEKFADATRISKPEVVVYKTTHNRTPYVSGFRYGQNLNMLLEYFPDTVIVSNETTCHNVVTKFGAKRAYEALSEHLKHLLDTTNLMDDIAAFYVSQRNGDGLYGELVKIPELVQEFGFQTFAANTNPHLKLWNEYGRMLRNDPEKYEEQIVAKQDAILQSLNGIGLVRQKRQQLSWLPHHHIWNYDKLDPDTKRITLSIIQVILRG